MVTSQGSFKIWWWNKSTEHWYQNGISFGRRSGCMKLKTFLS